MITREKARELVDEEIFNLRMASILSTNVTGNFSEIDALCYGFSTRIMARAFAMHDSLDSVPEEYMKVAVSAQCTTLACAIDDGKLDKWYIYNSYVNLMQEAKS